MPPLRRNPIAGSLLAVGLTLSSIGLSLPFTSLPAFAQDVDEETNIRVYDRASPAVVAIDAGGATGSGSIISADGLILTNAHVVENAPDTVTVTLADGRELSAEVIAFDANGLDLAALRISGEDDLPTIPLADLDSVRVGQRAFAIGSPFGLQNTFTIGIVSRLDPERGTIQTDAAINPGNSGGPLLNSQGELIGVNTAIFSPRFDAGNIGIGFAIAIDRVEPFLAAVEDGSAPRTAQTRPVPGTTQPPQSITLNAPPIDGTLDLGDNVLPMDNSFFDTYTFEGSAGDRISIEMQSGEIDPYLILLAPGGRELAQDDDSGGGTNAQIVVQLPESGTYTLIANSYAGDESGAYRLELKTTRTEGSIPKPQETGGTILLERGELGPGDTVLPNDNSFFDLHSFEGRAGQTVTITLESDQFDTYLVLLDSEGSAIDQNDDARNGNTNSMLRVTLPQSGTYRVVVNSYDNTGNGRYTLTVE
ncbi:DVUA0089 family protein [Oscillatoriales cyanobacterium LEGE 11467]|uniref:DVUA0089 family protein n=2 Tax=Zarconia TaxID=2992130 RepID=A0A928VYS8_9CYAN|nr:DVUA0089 family protein [Zarconia navalis LEGE 11467]